MFHVPVLRVAQFDRGRVQTLHLQQHPLFKSQISMERQKAIHFGTAAAADTIDVPDQMVGLRLTNQILRTKADQETSNLLFSPFSIQLLLSEIAVTSNENDATLEQLLCILKSDSFDHLGIFSFLVVPALLLDATSTGWPRLSFANGVWIDKSLPFDPSFAEILQSVFRVDSNQADFRNQPDQAFTEVNLWAEKKTRGLIKEILPPDSINKHTRIILANALCFKGAWNEPFKTEYKDFHLINGSSVNVPFMTSGDDQIIGVYDGFKALKLQYKQGDDGDDRQLSMYIFLPDAEDGLPSLLKKISSDSNSLEQYLPSGKVKVGEFRIPRFKISFGFEVSEVLKGLGLELPLLCGEGIWTQIVDLSAVGDQKIYISNIFHKSFIEVDEEGTKADVVTATDTGLSSTSVPPTDFVADHPFLFTIREDGTGFIMFVGHVVNPLEC